MTVYHGTNSKAAQTIKKEGFYKGTYFAFRKEDAIKFGGNCVFTVELSDEPSLWQINNRLMDLTKAGTDECWQFHTKIPIGVDKIKGYERRSNEISR